MKKKCFSFQIQDTQFNNIKDSSQTESTSQFVGACNIGTNSIRGVTQFLKMESAIEHAGFGSFQKRLIVSCGIFRAAESIQFIAVTLVAISMDDNLRSIDKALLVMMINLGTLCGSGVWGILSDHKGRKFAYLLCTIFSAIAVTVAALSTSYKMLLGMEFVIGFMISGYSVCTTLISEFMPVDKRGRALAFLQFFKVYVYILNFLEFEILKFL